MEKEIKKSNALIAEFMGIHEIMEDEYSRYEALEILTALDMTVNPCIHFNSALDVIDEKDLRFNESWDWLMPVVERIESMTKAVTITQNICTIKSAWAGDKTIYAQIASDYESDNTKISNTYKAVVEFIKWYNKE